MPTDERKPRRSSVLRRLSAAIVGGAIGFALSVGLLAVFRAPIEGKGTVMLLFAPIAGVVVGAALGVWIASRGAALDPPAPPRGG